MAILLPSPHLKHVKMTSGERRLAARLLTKLEDDYHCWFDVPIGKKQLRPDFTILHPGRGILVVEVKDWKFDSTIRSFDRKTFEILTEKGIKHVPNPLEQARAYALEIKEALESDPFLVEQENPKYKGRLIFPWGFGVAFPNISRREFLAKGMDEVIPADKVLCQDEMTEDAVAEAFQERLWSMFNYTFGTMLSLSRIDRIRWHLFPEIRVEQKGLFNSAHEPTHQTDPTSQSPGATITDMVPDIIKVMDKEQEKFTRNLGDGHRMIHGVAGSGKTLILAQRALQLGQVGMDKPVLVLCYNKSLAAKLVEMLRLKGAGDNVHVRHFHGWCKDLCTWNHLDISTDDSQEIFDRQVAAVVKAVETNRIPRAQYSAILIDEGHDFDADWFRVIVHMLDPETDSLLMVYDDVQSIYKRKKPKSWASVGINVPGRRSTIFKVNYRNTAEALDLAYRFVSGYLSGGSSSEDIPVVEPDRGIRHGSDPIIRKLESAQAEASFIADCFRARHKEGVQYRTMAVLCRFNRQVALFTKELNSAGIPAVVASYDFNDAPVVDSVQVLTMHASKGLEFNTVAIPDIGALPYSKVPEEDEARVLYVAMTRATEQLLLTYHSESVFTEKISSCDANGGT